MSSKQLIITYILKITSQQLLTYTEWYNWHIDYRQREIQLALPNVQSLSKLMFLWRRLKKKRRSLSLVKWTWRNKKTNLCLQEQVCFVSFLKVSKLPRKMLMINATKQYSNKHILSSPSVSFMTYGISMSGDSSISLFLIYSSKHYWQTEIL